MKRYAPHPTKGEPLRREHTRPFFLPDTTESFRGRETGTVTLPLHLDWSRSNTYLLDDSRRVVTLYGTVIRESACEDDLYEYLNWGVLVREWENLRLPSYIRRAWEQVYPELVSRK